MPQIASNPAAVYQIPHVGQRDIAMAEADLDKIIRSIAKQQIKSLTSAARARHGRLMSMAGKARDKDAKARYRHLARATREHAGAAARRLQMSAENTADAYKRAMAKAADEAQAIKPAKNSVKKAAKKKA
jgi:transcriptional regulator of nitric oxide reductase